MAAAQAGSGLGERFLMDMWHHDAIRAMCVCVYVCLLVCFWDGAGWEWGGGETGETRV